MADILPFHQQTSETSSPTPSTEKETSSTMHRSLTVHSEPHKTHGVLIRDSIIGFSDGLTVPFALCAGLSTLGNSKIVILGGIAELFAGSISMGLGAYLASTNDKCHYESEERRERKEVKESPREEEEEIYEIFERYGIQRTEAKSVVDALKTSEDQWVQVRGLTF